MCEGFNFSETPADHVSWLGYLNDPYSGVVGYFKDEMKGEPVYELIAIKPNSYLVRTVKATMYKHDSLMPQLLYINTAVSKGITKGNIKRLTH